MYTTLILKRILCCIFLIISPKGGGIVPDESLRVQHGHIAMMGAGQGIILTAPNNTRGLLTVDNSGNLTTSVS